MDGILTSKDIAELYGVSLRRAEQILIELENDHGSAVVGRLGRGNKKIRRYTTHGALERVLPTFKRQRVDVETEIAVITKNQTVLFQRMNDVAKRLQMLEAR